MSLDDEEHSGRPSNRTTTENVAKLRETILEDRRGTIHDVCNIVGLLYGMCQWISSHELNMWHIATKFVPRVTTLQLMCRSLCSSFRLQWTRQSSSTLPAHWTLPPVIFPYSPRWDFISGDDVLTALKRSGLYRRMWGRWHEMTFRSASDHGNPTGIDVSMPNGTISKGMGMNRNFINW